ncbi:MAG: cytochrome c maturation protein CcmE [Pseudomonadales bacterium]
MHPIRRQRLIIVIFIVLGASLAAALIFYAMRENLNLFYSPTEIAEGKAPMGKRIRAGGMVRESSVLRSDNSLEVRFVVTDYQNDVSVVFNSILPDMFAEGQGVVATGELGGDGILYAEEVLAKHDEEYMPPEVHDALQKSGFDHEGKSVQ